MSGTNLHIPDTSPTRQPRQNRTFSVGLPARSSLFPDGLMPAGDSIVPPPLPRRHSATPADVKPPIPKRSRNERPIPLVIPPPESPPPLPLQQQQVQEKQQQQQQQDLARSQSWKEAAAAAATAGPFINTLSDSNNEFESDENSAALNQASKDLGKKLQSISGGPKSSHGSRRQQQQQQQHLRSNRSPRRGQRSPTNKRQQQQFQQRSADDEDEDDFDPRISSTPYYKQLAHTQSYNVGPRIYDNNLSHLGARFQECSSSSKLESCNKAQDKSSLSSAAEAKATQTNLPPPLSSICAINSAAAAAAAAMAASKPVNARQDSNVSSDSFSQTSSPSYTCKTMEAPLLPQRHQHQQQANGRVPGRALPVEQENPPGSPITKSMSTPASLQTIVRFQNGSNMSLTHRQIMRDMRRPSSHYVTRGRLRFRFAQVLANAVALMIIAGGLAAYFKTYPNVSPKYIVENKTVETTNPATTMTETVLVEVQNPAPGVCLPIIVSFCQYPQVPYNYTVFPNWMGNFRQRDAQQELEHYDALIDVRCYELAALFLCTIFLPKCGRMNGQAVRPCRSLCYETKRRCGFFLDVFGLPLPEYMECDLFPESPDSNVCVGHHEVIEAEKRAARPMCLSGFQCDEKRCIPLDWRCDGHVDCEDHSDEIGCGECSDSERTGLAAISSKGGGGKSAANGLKSVLAQQASLHCGERRCMSATHLCDGVPDCPWAQDERNCLRLSEVNGDTGKGRLEIYNAHKGKYMSACVSRWTSATARDICGLLGYTNVGPYRYLRSESNTTLNLAPVETAPQRWYPTPKSTKNLLREFQECTDEKDYSTIDLTCSNYECGKRLQNYGNLKVRKRIVGGVESAPGDWPFLAALLGGPEQVFYCAGVLIADQWVLTAAHCVGNHSDTSGWTIQLGITRRHAHTYLGKKMKVMRVIPHPNYNEGVPHDNDVALFQLEHRVEFHDHLRPICLPPANAELRSGTFCTVIGWGKKEDTETSEYEPAINEVAVPILNREICNTWLLHKEVNVTEGMICAGYPEGGKDACQGDSGGPLLCQFENEEDRWFVGGIVSWGIKCAHPRLPGVYAFVPKYIPWITKQIEAYTTVKTG